ncbi:MAG: hypothetical protein ACLSAP_03230 [Oscillospiraceae bacterium]
MISPLDFEQVFQLCKDMISDFYDAAARRRRMSFAYYVRNENFKDYMQRRLRSEWYQNYQQETCVFGVPKMEWLSEKRYISISLPVMKEESVGGNGSAEEIQLIISNTDGQLYVEDWLSSELHPFDGVVRKGIITLDDPHFWENEEKYGPVLEAAKEYEQRYIEIGR